MNSMSKNVLTGLGFGVLGYALYTLTRNTVRYCNFKEKVVVISGGSRGLGLVLAKEFAKEGAIIYLLARDGEELRRAQNQLQFEVPNCTVFFSICDSTRPSDVQNALREAYAYYGRIDVIVNNAGVITTAPYENSSAEDFEESLRVHFWAAYNMTEAALPYLRESQAPRIINISSIGGKIGVPHLSSYCVGKFALAGYSETLRAELMRENIYVTSVYPGLMRTGSFGHATFKGQYRKEYAWFSIADSLPLLTVSAEKAARDIVNAARIGRAELVISTPAKLATRFARAAPEIFSDIMSLTNAFLPSPSETEQKVEGRGAHSALSPSPITRLSERAARRNNEQSI
ncbi:SDR family NAD(P)-dependent oxidoreductase [Bdellovibrio sp. 22V]|uniref:SDR family NAD(P)-dependent oxidoreductase n=1 Tax=Bdellovibrio TaxID=958 RepID=UPI002542FCCF|nr:SDR family NAD(P)-dependent oxidoreductase [Bdellovibrio sp. 22V]WII71869.1 SDR family NAD(P)-dependent oxidoreductase [Bdellovibrio sp. 22V]